MPKVIAWLLTFLFVNAAWVVFRADNFHTATTILRFMVDIDSVDFMIIDPEQLLRIQTMPLLLNGLILIYVLQDIFFRNTQTWVIYFRPHIGWTTGVIFAFVTGIVLMMNQNRFTEFIYFQF